MNEMTLHFRQSVNLEANLNLESAENVISKLVVFLDSFGMFFFTEDVFHRMKCNKKYFISEISRYND